MEDIEARVNELRGENGDLQAHLMNVTQRTTEVQKQRMAMEKLMVTKLAEIGEREDSDQSELAKVVKQYTDIYADYGKCRQREVRRIFCTTLPFSSMLFQFDPMIFTVLAKLMFLSVLFNRLDSI